MGFVKFSVNLIAEGDKPVSLVDERLANQGSSEGHVSLPASLSTDNYQINMKIFKGEELKKMDSWFGSVDGYI